MAGLESQLMQLESAQLVRLLREPEIAYLFKHALVQETAYLSLLVKNRRALHKQVARCYEELFPDRIQEFAPILAQHYADAGDDPQATLKYARLAGDGAWDRNAMMEAARYYAVALAAAAEVSAEESTELFYLSARCGRALELSGQYEAALAHYEATRAMGQKRGDRALELAALTAMGTILAVPSPLQDLDKAEKIAESGLELAKALGDQAAEAKILWNRMLATYFLAHPEESVACGERSIALARQLGLREQLAFSLNDIGRSYMAVGLIERADEAGMEANALWRELGNQPMLADNLVGMAENATMLGNYDRVLELTAEADRINRAINNRWGQSYSGMTRAYVNIERGEVSEAITTVKEAGAQAQAGGFSFSIVGSETILASIYASLGASGQALELLRHISTLDPVNSPAVGYGFGGLAGQVYLAAGDLAAAAKALEPTLAHLKAAENGYPLVVFGIVPVWVVHANLAIAMGQFDRAIEFIDTMLAVTRRLHFRPFQADALLTKANALIGKGELAAAGELLESARSDAEGIGSKRALWEILATQAELEARLGHEEAASSLRSRAGDIVEFIADHIDEPDLRAAFLHQPKVQAVLAAKA